MVLTTKPKYSFDEMNEIHTKFLVLTFLDFLPLLVYCHKV